MSKTCEIVISTLSGNYYHSFGATRSRSEFKTFKGAVRSALRKGYNVVNADTDPVAAYLANEKKTKIVTNLMSGKLCRIPVNTPSCCDPSRETYWTM